MTPASTVHRGVRSAACLADSTVGTARHMPAVPALAPGEAPLWTPQGSTGQGSLYSRQSLGTAASSSVGLPRCKCGSCRRPARSPHNRGGLGRLCSSPPHTVLAGVVPHLCQAQAPCALLPAAAAASRDCLIFWGSVWGCCHHSIVVYYTMWYTTLSPGTVCHYSTVAAQFNCA